MGTTMSIFSYALARFPDIQKRVHEELDEMTSDGDISYQAITKMEYFDQVWCESQRLWPFGFG